MDSAIKSINTYIAQQVYEPKTNLEVLIAQACHRTLASPNMALCLEICDYINQKQGGSAYEACNAILHYIHDRNQNVALLALELLDVCVKNCSFSMQLQVSTKEFLNEFVRRFPERPPPLLSPIQHKQLQLLEEWKETFVTKSRFKDDFKSVLDMCRLLSYKGYIFPGVSPEVEAVLNPEGKLKSPDELEEDERAAKSAKLQELLRQATPMALEEANVLMKELAGYEPEKKTDYRKVVRKELNQLKIKALELLNILSTTLDYRALFNNAALQDLYSEIKNAHPKVQKFISEETDEKQLSILLELNDIFNQVFDKFNGIEKGEIIQQSQPVAKKQENNSLIDLLGDDTVPPPPATQGNEDTASMLQGLDFMGQGMGANQQFNPQMRAMQPLINISQQTNKAPSYVDLFSQNQGANLRLSRPEQYFTLMEKNGLRISLIIRKQGAVADIKSSFTNSTLKPMTGLEYKIAVPKNMTLHMEPLKENQIAPQTQDGMSHVMRVDNPDQEMIKFRYIIKYRFSGQDIEEKGEFREMWT